MATVAIDPVTTEIVRSAFKAAADEMNATLIRSAYTPVIYEMKDCSVALLDAEHQVLGQSAGLPIFLGNLEICTRLTEQTYGREAWRPGDVWGMNDSYLTGTHLNDMTVFGPIFHAGELVGFEACRAHWLDLGAQIACINTGQARLEAIIERHGVATVLAAREQIFAQTERYEREAIAAIP